MGISPDSTGLELNQQPRAYKAPALPLSFRWEKRGGVDSDPSELKHTSRTAKRCRERDGSSELTSYAPVSWGQA